MKFPTSFSKALDISENTAWCTALSEFLLVCRVLKLNEHDGDSMSAVSAVAAAFASASSAFAPAFASARLASAVATTLDPTAATGLTSGFATARVLENICLL